MEPWRAIIKGIIETVCFHEELDPAQSQVDFRFLVKNDARCALEIAVNGPRRMRPTAVWSWMDTKIFYYDSAGKRWKEDLTESGVMAPSNLLEIWGKHE